MSATLVIARRASGTIWRSPQLAVAAASFLALAGAFFTRALLAGEGRTLPVAVLWAVSAVPFLPVPAALLTMRLFADDRRTGRIELLLTAPVPERSFVIGRFLAAYMAFVAVLALYAVVPLIILPIFAPALSGKIAWFAFLPAATAMLLQGTLWCACGLFASICFRHAATAALATLVATIALPAAAYGTALAWMPTLRAHLASQPLVSQAAELAAGTFSLPVVIFYLSFAVCALFASSKTLAASRFRGSNHRAWMFRASSAFVVSLALVFASLACAIAWRLPFSFDIPATGVSTRMSARTRQILAETQGEVQIVCFLARRSPVFSSVQRLLSGLERTARAVAGARMKVRYVDPRWDSGPAEAMTRTGTKEGTIVFRCGRRVVKVPVKDLFGTSPDDALAVSDIGMLSGESVCASALQRLTNQMRPVTICWTVGHGEASFESYDPDYGFSDIARSMLGDGYRLKKLDLTKETVIPPDCSVMIIAGARVPFSRIESSRIAGWLRSGGRLMTLVSGSPNAGVGALLADWGVKTLPFTVVSPRTLTGTDVVVSDFSGHKITEPLSGVSVVFAHAAPLEISSAKSIGDPAQADRTEATPLVLTDEDAWGESDMSVRPWSFDLASEPKGPLAIAVALERGGGAAEDLAYRPTRIVVVGDAAFVSNGALSMHANANRDLFMNALAWLAGFDAITAARIPGDAVVTGLDRSGWIRFGAHSALIWPIVVLVLLLVPAAKRRFLK